MSRLQILARGGDVCVLVDGREIERVESFVVGVGAAEDEPLACLYMVPESITFEGIEIPMEVKTIDEDRENITWPLATRCGGCQAQCDITPIPVEQLAAGPGVPEPDPIKRPAAEASLTMGYSGGKLRIHSVLSQDGIKWIAAAKEQSLVEFLRDARVPLAEIALALAELTEERR